jgi:hypothetical protein
VAGCPEEWVAIAAKRSGGQSKPQLTVSPPSAAAACGTVGAARRHNGYAGTDLSMVPPSTWRSAGSSPTWRASANPCWMVYAASDAKRRGWLDRMRDYGTRLIWACRNTRTSRSRCPTFEPAFMFVKMALEIWKCWFPWPLRIFSMSVENDFQQPRENQGTRHFQCPACPPLRGTACVGRRRPVLGGRGARLSHGCGKGGG